MVLVGYAACFLNSLLSARSIWLGDEDLNKFLLDDAKPAQELRIANTFILEDDGRIAAYFCLLSDKVSKDEDEHTRLMYFDMMEIAE